MQNNYSHLSAESELSSFAQVSTLELPEYREENQQSIDISGDGKAIVSALKNYKGANIRVVWQRQLKTLKTAGNALVSKRTSAIIRAGINFANLASVKHGIETGERGEVQSLPWGEWQEFPFIISHTPKGKTEVCEYLRLYPSSFENNSPRVEYTLNGLPATLDQVRPLCLASEFSKGEEIECFTIKVQSLVSLG